MAEEIISYAEQQLSATLSHHVHIALSDHLSFAVERIARGISIQNKLLNEIKSLYQPGVCNRSMGSSAYQKETRYHDAD